MDQIDPRIHFALVCASSSCPPISFYSAGKLDEELNIAGKAFLTGGGIVLDKQENRILLSRIFKWYAGDFGGAGDEILKFISAYVYDEEEWFPAKYKSSDYFENNVYWIQFIPSEWKKGTYKLVVIAEQETVGSGAESVFEFTFRII